MNPLGRKYDGLGLTQKQTVGTKGVKDENKTGAAAQQHRVNECVSELPIAGSDYLACLPGRKQKTLANTQEAHLFFNPVE
jgi:hypothetical protein